MQFHHLTLNVTGVISVIAASKGVAIMDKDIEFFTAEELAELLKVSPRTIQRLVNRKELPAIRVGRQLRFRREWVDEWLDRNTTDDSGANSA